MKIKTFKIRLSDEYQAQDEEELNLFLETISTKKTSSQLVTNDETNYWSILVFYEQKTTREPRVTQTEKVSFPTDTELTNEEQKIFEAFKIWRQTKANELNFPAYMICSNSELISLVKTRPETIEQLIKIKGFGDQKIAKFGDEIIALLNSF
jgi:superfamily II DNA helicase RecQ